MKIGVIGTGVAGALFAAAARREAPGIEIEAFEKIQLGERDDAGTGLNIGPNALKAMRLHGGIALKELLDASLPWTRWVIDLTDGTRLIDLDMIELAGEPGIRIRWADLYAVMRAASADLTTYDRALAEIEVDTGGRLIPVFRTAAGEAVRAGPFDLLISADGRYSRIRELVAGKPEAHFPGIGTWRLLVRDVGDDCPIDEYGQYFCGNARLLSFRLPQGDVYIAGSFPLPGEGPMPEEMKTAAVQRAFFEPQGRAPSREVAWMLDQIDQHVGEMNWARTQEIEPLYHAMDGRILFLGDACHAMFQTLGQGATQAIEDALTAARCLSAGSPKAVCQTYEAMRSERVAFAAGFTREATDTMLPGADPVAGSLAKAQEPFLSKLRKLYVDVS